MNLRELSIPADRRPILVVVVDTESQFDWTIGTHTDFGDVSAVQELPRLLEPLAASGDRACLVVDHPMATQDQSAELLRQWSVHGAELGVHLQPWTAPPFAGQPSTHASYCSNLPIELVQEKAIALRRAVQALSVSPVRTFKAGRYGISEPMFPLLHALGFDIDLSFAPCYDMRHDGGPDWTSVTSHPVWVGKNEQVLELPTTAAHLGLVSPWLGGVAIPAGALAWLRRLRLAHACRLSPEGNSLAELKAVARSLWTSGLRLFSLSLHSPSLSPGCTPYVRDLDERKAFVERTLAFVQFFKSEWGGEVMLPSQVRREALQWAAWEAQP